MRSATDRQLRLYGTEQGAQLTDDFGASITQLQGLAGDRRGAAGNGFELTHGDCLCLLKGDYWRISLSISLSAFHSLS